MITDKMVEFEAWAATGIQGIISEFAFNNRKDVMFAPVYGPQRRDRTYVIDAIEAAFRAYRFATSVNAEVFEISGDVALPSVIYPGAALQAAEDAREHTQHAPFDAEALIAAAVPSGSICDPQQVADAIRSWFAQATTEESSGVAPIPTPDEARRHWGVVVYAGGHDLINLRGDGGYSGLVAIEDYADIVRLAARHRRVSLLRSLPLRHR